MSEIEHYPGAQVSIVNDGKRCIHSRYCVLNLNSVFLPNVDGPWIKPDAAGREAVIVTILCDSADKYLSERFWMEG